MHLVNALRIVRAESAATRHHFLRIEFISY
jgi:hypothetical protein